MLCSSHHSLTLPRQKAPSHSLAAIPSFEATTSISMQAHQHLLLSKFIVPDVPLAISMRKLLTIILSLALFPSSVFAIAFDTGNGGGFGGGFGNVTAFNFTFVNTAGNFLYCAISISGAGSGTPTVTYNSVSLTQIDGPTSNGATHLFTYYLKNPATGSHTVQFNWSSAQGGGGATCNSYTGASSLPVGGHTTNTGSGTTFTDTITVSGGNNWLVDAVVDSVGTIAAGSGTTARSNGGSLAIGDSNGIVSGGSQSLHWSDSSADWASNIIYLVPVGSGAGGSSLSYSYWF